MKRVIIAAVAVCLAAPLGAHAEEPTRSIGVTSGCDGPTVDAVADPGTGELQAALTVGGSRKRDWGLPRSGCVDAIIRHFYDDVVPGATYRISASFSLPSAPHAESSMPLDRRVTAPYVSPYASMYLWVGAEGYECYSDGSGDPQFCGGSDGGWEGFHICSTGGPCDEDGSILFTRDVTLTDEADYLSVQANLSATGTTSGIGEVHIEGALTLDELTVTKL